MKKKDKKSTILEKAIATTCVKSIEKEIAKGNIQGVEKFSFKKSPIDTERFLKQQVDKAHTKYYMAIALSQTLRALVYLDRAKVYETILKELIRRE